MQELEMDLRIRLTESQYEVLKTVAEASGDTLDEYLHTVVIQGIQSDIDLYFGHSKAIKEKLYKKLGRVEHYLSEAEISQ
jgi:predicted DNA-binding protein